MTRDDILRMAREAELFNDDQEPLPEHLERFAAFVAAAEREQWITVAEQAVETLKNNRRTHYYCEDKWYSCPKHEEGCANDWAGIECNCGADKANEEIDAVIVAITDAIRARGV